MIRYLLSFKLSKLRNLLNNSIKYVVSASRKNWHRKKTGAGINDTRKSGTGKYGTGNYGIFFRIGKKWHNRISLNVLKFHFFTFYKLLFKVCSFAILFNISNLTFKNLGLG